MAPFFQPLLSLIVLTALWTTAMWPTRSFPASRYVEYQYYHNLLTESVASSTTTTSASPIPTPLFPVKNLTPCSRQHNLHAFVNEQGISLEYFLASTRTSSLPTHSVAKPPTAPNDTISDCAQYYTAADGDTCERYSRGDTSRHTTSFGFV
ncbi:hypothetical protein B0H10DRAFT_1949098 [Mycena sp. CBHHK59/15]|nr:hypothetical protein B0H10DRAFT_1949098 [Mycena sp. CBHHK59/15]